MILYNVTLSISEDIDEEWVKWMKEDHIPRILSCGIFKDYKLVKMLSEKENTDMTYALQLYTNTMADLHQYQIKYATNFQSIHNEKFENKYVAFRTLLEVLDQS